MLGFTMEIEYHVLRRFEIRQFSSKLSSLLKNFTNFAESLVRFNFGYWILYDRNYFAEIVPYVTGN